MADAGTIFNSRLLEDVETARKHLHEMASETKVPAPEHAFAFAGAALKICRKEIVERGCRGLVVEGHGDLRAEHVCLTKPPIVLYRLEIDHGIRTLDPFYEINALGLECGLLGSAWIRAVLVAGLSGAMAPPSRTLLTAYGVIALLTRARFAADHFRDDDLAKPEKWRWRTKQNVAAAAQLLTKSEEAWAAWR
jgi:aminoglycoside phosphotransferase family enzyme